MTEHLSPEQIAAYRQRKLAPGDLVAADFHLAVCDACRKSAADAVSLALLDGIAAAKHTHLSYEQMEGYADGALDPVSKELVLAHVALCGQCARELREFADFIPVMDAAIEKATPKKEIAAEGPAASKAGFWRRFSAAVKRPQWVIVAAAGVVLAVMIPTLSRNQRPPADAISEAQLASLPADIRTEVTQIVDAQQGMRPSSLAKFPTGTVAGLRSPVNQVVEEQRPMLRWNALSGIKSITVYATGGARVAESGDVVGSEWQTPLQLQRGEVYRWILQADGKLIGEGSFEVLSDAGYREWSEAKASAPNSHLLLGALAQQLGMLDQAEREYLALRTEKPQSETAARLLRNLQTIRGQYFLAVP